MSRKVSKKEFRTPVLSIIGEGLTERYYFSTLRKLCGYKYNCKPRNFTEQDYKGLQRLVDLSLQNGEMVACVYDEDVTRFKSAETKKLAQMKEKYRNNKKVLLCGSMPSIEFWFLLHFVESNRYFANSEEVIKLLRNYITNFEKHEKFLSQEKWVQEMIRDDKIFLASDRAKRLNDKNLSFTEVWRLIDHLNAQDPRTMSHHT